MRPTPHLGTRRCRLITAASVALLVLPVLAACDPGDDPNDNTITVGPTRPNPVPTPPTGGLVLEQGGLPGMLLNRDVLNVGVPDLEAAFGGKGSFFLAGQTEKCGLAINKGLGIAATTNPDLAIVAVMVQTPGAQTKEGVKIGDSIDNVLSTYANAHAEVDTRISRTGGPLVLVNDLETPDREPDMQSLLYVFETDTSRTVTRIRAGFLPYVLYVDYCSEKASRPESIAWPLQ